MTNSNIKPEYQIPKPLGLSVSRIIYILVLSLGVSLYITKPISDPDLGWHTVVGRWILAHRALPTEDHWNMFAVGVPWVAYSWSSEIAYAFLDSLWGFTGLILLQILIGAAFTFVCISVFARIAGSFGIGILVGVFTALGSFNHFTLRPQLLTWIYFSLLLLVLWRIERRGSNKADLFWLVLIMCAWGNSHITTVFGVGTAFLWLLESRGWRTALGCAAAALFGSLLTPYLGQEWLVFFSKTSHPFTHQGISEFNSSSLLQTTGGLLFMEVTLFLLFLHHRPRALSKGKIFLIFGYILAGAAVVKFLPFSLIATSAGIALLWGAESEPSKAYGNLGEGLFRLGSIVKERPRLVSIPILLFVLAKGALLIAHPLDQYRSGSAAFDYAFENKLPEPFLVPFDFGGYLMYRISDKKGDLKYLSPIDGRTNVTPPEIWDEFIAAYRGQAGWDRYLNRVNPGTIIWRTDSPFVSLLLTGGKWKEVFRAGEGVNQTSVLTIER